MHGDLNARLTTGGFRSTPQREHVYNASPQEGLLPPTAEEVFILSEENHAGDFHGHGLQLPRRAGTGAGSPGR